MRRPINTVNGTYKDPNRAYSAQDALNVIPMMTEKSGTRTVSQYRQAPGLKPFCRIGQNGGEAGFVAAGAGRGLRVVDGKLYAVAGRNLWQITASGVSVNYGTIPGVGRVSMAHNQRGLGNELAIDNGQSRYVFNTQTQVLQKVTDESFPGSVKSFFIDGYIGYIEPQGRYWGHSDLSNALVYNAFDVYEAEGQPDRIVSAHVSNREVLIAGQDTIEAYVNSPSGSGEAPFVRATNTVIESGCSARDSFCTVGQFTVYLDQNRTVQVLNGYTPAPISTAVIDSALQACTKQQIANAYAFALESEGFQIYYLTVPGKFTFGYDFKNREWHRRSSTGLDWWAVTDVVQWNGRWFALDSRRGDILELRWYDYPFDVQEELVREWVTGSISADQNPIFVHELELLFGCGGQAYTTVEFPDQPLGPAITGSAPDGTVGVAYSFTYTTTPGDAEIVRTTIRSGALLPGLSWDQYTATISGTPTASGPINLEFRTFDTAGLYDDHADSILIQDVLIAVGDISGGGKILRITDSTNWANTPADLPVLTGGAQFGLGIPGRGLIWGPSQLAKTDDFGVSWQVTAADLGGSGSGRQGDYRDGLLLIAGGLDGLYRSSDRGDTTANLAYPANPRSNIVRFLGDLTIIWSIYSANLSVSSSTNAQFNAGSPSWSSGAAHGLYVGGNYTSAVIGDKLVLGGSATSGGKPRIFITADGVTGDNVTISDADDGDVISISSAVVDGNLRWVIQTSAGQSFWSEDEFDTWTLATGSVAGLAVGVHDGTRFVAAGYPTGVTAIYSSTGSSFSAATQPFTSDIRLLFRIPADE